MKLPLLISLFFIATSITGAQERYTSEAQEIVALRQLSNLAFKNHQIQDILSFLIDDVNISASNGDIITGRNDFFNILKVVFKDQQDLFFIREPVEILVNHSNDEAWESGIWKALRPETPSWQSYGGSYSAAWIRINGKWKIKSELFVRL